MLKLSLSISAIVLTAGLVTAGEGQGTAGDLAEIVGSGEPTVVGSNVENTGTEILDGKDGQFIILTADEEPAVGKQNA